MYAQTHQLAPRPSHDEIAMVSICRSLHDSELDDSKVNVTDVAHDQLSVPPGVHHHILL